MPHSRAESVGRIPVVAVGPSLEEGRWPARAVVGEAVPLFATVFREGHDAVSATAIITGPNGKTTTLPMPCEDWGNSRYVAHFTPATEGDYTFSVEGWSDPVATWARVAEVKLHAGVDQTLVLSEGVHVLERANEEVDRTPAQQKLIFSAIASLRDATTKPEDRLAKALSAKVGRELNRAPLRDFVTVSRDYPLRVQRERALFSAWYEMFPRSEGAVQDPKTKRWTSGTFATAVKRLPAIAGMGFDTIYLTPIHPIGTTNRKGRNNSLKTVAGDPGSPYAVGSKDGGHDAIHPDLGTMADFKEFVATAKTGGMEVALDLALQCSPDHPWVTDHPEWFTTLVDGSIAFAENPPKKYQDIYPLNFDNDPEGIYTEIRRVVQVWIDAGVTAFRVDNPHTKPLAFWERLLADVAANHPDVIFLSEAFTLPAMMHTLAKIGFHQSYTYFTWRQTATEMADYLAEVHGDASAYMRPNFWPTTHDILTPDLQGAGAAMFEARAVLAATGSPSWGIYSGYELVEDVSRPGADEQIDSEKYEFKPRDWSAAKKHSIAALLTALNKARHAHPALQRLGGLAVHQTDNPAVMCFSKFLPADQSPTGKADAVIVAVNMNPVKMQDATIIFDLAAIGLSGGATIRVDDAITKEKYTWDEQIYVQLDPKVSIAHVAGVDLT